MHEHGIIDSESGDQKKPEVITYYNSTKGGVDVVDELKGGVLCSKDQLQMATYDIFCPYEHRGNQ